MQILMTPIAFVKNSRIVPLDDDREEVISEIELAPDVPSEALHGISHFSHLEIIYYFDQVESKDIAFSGQPRGNPAYPIVGIYGQRKKDRPSQIGLATVQLLIHKDRSVIVKYLDAINGTPVLDIKPVC